MDQILILAGGKGSRMKSNTPKVLKKIKGKALISWTLERIARDFKKPAIIVGFKSSDVKKKLGKQYIYIEQAAQLGTGHAVQVAKESLKGNSYKNLIVIPGDHPLLTAETLKSLLKIHNKERATLSIATVTVPHFNEDYAGFYNSGRVIRTKEGKIKRIVELKDASPQEKKVLEVHPSYYCFNAKWLWENISKIKNKNKAQEYYLTDILNIAFQQDKRIATLKLENLYEGLGVNTKEQLVVAKKYL